MPDRLRRRRYDDDVPAARKLACVEPEDVLAGVCRYYGISDEDLRRRRSGHPGRDVAAWLARQLTTATLRELSEPLGLSHPDSVRNLTRRVDRKLNRSPQLPKDIEAIRERLPKTENRV